MSLKKDTVEIINYTGSDGDGDRETSIDFYGFKELDVDSLESIVGLSEITFNSLNSGLNDLSVDGYSNTTVLTNYVVNVASNTFVVDTFDATRDGQVLFSNTDINSDLTYDVGNGFVISFGSNTGHNEGDSWAFNTLTTFNVAHQLARIVTSHEGTDTDLKSKMEFFTNQEIVSSNLNFTGTGTNDLSIDSNLFTTVIAVDARQYSIKIDGTSPDTFTWSLDNFSTTEASGVQITASTQKLSTNNDYIEISFGSTAGHAINDLWSFETTTIEPAMTLFSNGLVSFSNTVIKNDGTSYTGIAVYDINDNLLSG